MKVAVCEDTDWLLSEEAYSIYAPCMYHPTCEDYRTQMEGFLQASSVKVFVCEDRNRKAGMMVWGRGLIPEAVRELMRYGFENLKLNKIWCGYFDGNEKSKRVQEKCGFHYHHTAYNVPCAIEGVLRTEHITCLSKEEWQSVR